MYSWSTVSSWHLVQSEICIVLGSCVATFKGNKDNFSKFAKPMHIRTKEQSLGRLTQMRRPFQMTLVSVFLHLRALWLITLEL